jgi:hypothetical protein
LKQYHFHSFLFCRKCSSYICVSSFHTLYCDTLDFHNNEGASCGSLYCLPSSVYSEYITISVYIPLYSQSVLLFHCFYFSNFPDSGKGHPNVRGPKKEWIMNPNGKSYVCILHEYVQHALKKQPSYEFKELGNSLISEVVHFIYLYFEWKGSW